MTICLAGTHVIHRAASQSYTLSAALSATLMMVLSGAMGCASVQSGEGGSGAPSFVSGTDSYGDSEDENELAEGELIEAPRDSAASDLGAEFDSGHISDVGGNELLDENVEQEVEATSVDHTEALARQDSDTQIPTVINERVEWWIQYYTGRGRERFQRHLDRADMYQPVIQKVLRESGVPEELLFLALIESGFVTHAKSHAGAVGYWQFMPATGRRYGLQVNRVVDERSDLIRATRAAAAYLSDLHNLFNNWYLAFAAYNCGEYRVVRSILKGKTRDFWELSELKLLPKETRHYVPKFLAAMMIATDREKYGFQTNETEKFPEVTGLQVPSGVKLADVAKQAGLSVAEIESLNPHLLKKRVPATGKSYSVWLPLDKSESVAEIQASLVPSVDAEIIREDEQSIAPTVHKVVRGENLNLIAKKYSVSVSSLKKLNGLKNANIRAGQRLKIVSGSNGTSHEGVLVAQSSNHGQSPSKYKGRGFSGAEKRLSTLKEESRAASALLRKSNSDERDNAAYTTRVVRRGENLALIAKEFDMTVTQLKEINNLRSSRIFPGKRLKVFQQKSAQVDSIAAKPQDFVFYRVKNGDSLLKIGRRFGVEPDDIKQANEFVRNELYAGELIRVPSGG